MAPDQLECPDQKTLNQLASGNADDATLANFETHLQHCDRCGREFDALSEISDTHVRQLSQFPLSEDDTHEVRELFGELLAHPEQFGTDKTLASVQPRSVPSIQLPMRISEYELLNPLGKGAHGSVYKARHLKLEREVAIKLLHRNSLNDEGDGAFLDEMRAIGKLDHAHIVRATDAGQSGDWYFLVMEFQPGQDVSSILRRHAKLKIADACEIVRQTAEALCCIHSHGLVHRDIKPSNLLLTGSGQVKLLDLGLVSLDNHHETDVLDSVIAAPRGTADYMSPEQWNQYAQVDIRGDIYSLGCTLYKLLVGFAPFRFADSRREAHCHTTPDLVSSIRTDVPARLAEIVARMIAKDPADRYQTPAEIVEQLQRFCHGAQLRRLVDTGIANAQSKATSGALLRAPANPVITRRAMWGGLICAGLVAWKFSSHQKNSRRPLRFDIWRPLAPQQPRHLMQKFEASWNSELGELTFPAGGSGIRLLNLGQPIHRRFTFSIRVSAPGSSWGVFFGFNTSSRDDSNVHVFQSIEISSDGPQTQLTWSEYQYRHDAVALGLIKRELLADVFVDQSTHDPTAHLEVTLGERGFPSVVWNGKRYPQSDWELSFEGRQASSLPDRVLSQEYRGRLGVLAHEGAVTFHNPRLRYRK